VPIQIARISDACGGPRLSHSATMPTTDPRVTSYIAGSPAFARPILAHLRDLVHRSCPATAETIKWGIPYFMRGRILCFMGAFKQHCVFGLRRGVIPKRDHAMGHFGRITRLEDLPDDSRIIELIWKADLLNDFD